MTGVDLVAAQLAIAEGAHVTDIPGLEHGTPVPHGHAIEFRINAEDPSLGFVPFPGIVERLNVPTGPGIRFDPGVAQGGAIPGQFDDRQTDRLRAVAFGLSDARPPRIG